MDMCLALLVYLFLAVFHSICSGWWGVVFSSIYSIMHAEEELNGDGGPLWEYMGEIVGVRVSSEFGFLVFSLALPATLVALAIGAYGFEIPICLSLLFGARVGDTLLSHWGLALARVFTQPFRRKNPGIHSTVLYVLEVLGLYIFWRGQFIDLYVLIGISFFAAVLPTLWLGQWVLPKFIFKIRESKS